MHPGSRELWIAFLGACLGSFVIFALLDPEALNEAWVLPWEMGSRLAYSLGFLFLYLVSLFASGLTIFMIRTGPRRGHAIVTRGDPCPSISIANSSSWGRSKPTGTSS